MPICRTDERKLPATTSRDAVPSIEFGTELENPRAATMRRGSMPSVLPANAPDQRRNRSTLIPVRRRSTLREAYTCARR